MIVDPLFPPASEAPVPEPHGGPTLPVVRIPGRPSSVSGPARGSRRGKNGGEDPIRFETLDAADGLPGGGVIFEPIYDGGEALLLMLIAAADHPVRVNGSVPPIVSLLRPGDQLLWDDDVLLHVTVYNRPRRSAAGPERVGAECPLCRVPFRAEDTVYQCPCGAALHCAEGAAEGAEGAAAGADQESEAENEALECAELASACPRCTRRISLTEGFEYVPERS